MEEWKTYKLADICDLIPGFAFKSADFGDYEDRAIKIGDIQPPYVNYKTTSGLDVHQYTPSKLAKYIVRKGDFVLAMTGATIGKIGRYIHDTPAYLNQRVLLFKPHSSVNSKFVYYSLLSPLFQKYVLNHIDSETAQPNISGKSVSGFEINLPSRKVQDRIADLMSAIDDKIDLNTRINHNLLNVAQELFNSFISGKTYNTDTWRRASLLDIANYLNGLAMQKYPTKDGEVGLPVLKIKELGQEVCDVNSDRCSESIPEQYIVDDGDIIFSWSGTLLVDFWCGGRCGLNQHLFKVSSSDYPDWLIYFWTKHHLDRFIRIAKDKAVTMGHIKRNDLGTAEVVIPEDTLMKKLNDEISPIISEYIERRIENRKLQSFRDSLLPELISGRITC